MEMFGLISLAILAFYWSYPDKINKMEKRIKKMEKKKNGRNEMSKLISELKGKVCTIAIDTELSEVKCEVVDIDDEWLKCCILDKKGEKQKEMLYRIDSIQKVSMVDENKK
ncbi:hypothetical protein [Anaerosacchariphilus polymeriproducens]|uniref:Uncharacterized protein n=1 Tax=Anaerosacchariphilus polymeriproducens TaxID=1812858 RepID=A0A371ARG9_9FIRM|nr:hypothetical protein [Anaerosacchariphilus polymeriproducens]RDU22171.1 hypothetical protein DWV06_16710 [Anaerosacchariphilus polymeriproducens]